MPMLAGGTRHISRQSRIPADRSIDCLTMNENDPFNDQDHPDVRRRLRALGSAPLGSGVAERAIERVRSAGRPKMRGTRLKLLSAAAIAGFAAGGVGLAAADVLPSPVQDVAHNALDAVGVHVPPGHVRYNDPKACPGGPYANHGAYVRSHPNDPNAGKSPCGKPVQSVNPAGGTKGADDKGDDAGDAGSPGKGPPPWAHGHGKSDKHGATSTVPGHAPAAKKPSETTTSTSSTTSAPPTTGSTTSVPTVTTSTSKPA
jgi:hypothetical protein